MCSRIVTTYSLGSRWSCMQQDRDPGRKGSHQYNSLTAPAEGGSTPPPLKLTSMPMCCPSLIYTPPFLKQQDSSLSAPRWWHAFFASSRAAPSRPCKLYE